MKNAILTLALLFAPLAVAQPDKIVATNLIDHPFQVDFASGRRLTLYLRAGDIKVVGTDDDKISIRVSASKNQDEARKIKAAFERSDNSGELRLSGGPRDDIQITVEIPKSTGLFVRMSAGDLEISHIVGDKDIELHAGELTVNVGDPADYSQVDASVNAGGIEAPPFGEDHGGLFRSFHKTGNGKYKLHAHVGAGDVNLH
jgi:hypothetical protein